MISKKGKESANARVFIKNEVAMNPSAFAMVNPSSAFDEMRPSTLGRELVRGFIASNLVSQKRLNAIAKFRAKIKARAQRMSVLAMNPALMVEAICVNATVTATSKNVDEKIVCLKTTSSPKFFSEFFSFCVICIAIPLICICFQNFAQL